MMKSNELAWVAGIVEGEGTISIAGPNGRRTYPQLTVEMTDLDVVKRLAEYFNSNVTSRSRSGLKTLYRAAVSGKNAAYWMLLLYSLLGNRRRSRIREVLRLYGTRTCYKPGIAWTKQKEK